MNFPLVPEYQFDIDGTNPENEIDNETIDFPKSEHITVIVPRHAPFFVDGLVLKDKTMISWLKGKIIVFIVSWVVYLHIARKKLVPL